jgi:hypothetical protein
VGDAANMRAASPARQPRAAGPQPSCVPSHVSLLTRSPFVFLLGAAHCHTVKRASRALGTVVALLLLVSCRIERAPAGRPGGGYAVEPDSVASAEVYAALHAYYATLSAREWRRAESHFLPRAVITEAVSASDDSGGRPRTVGVEAFIARAGRARGLGFADEPMHASIVTYGSLADAWVTFRARIRVGRDSTVSRFGIDAFQLVKLGGRWRIAGLATQNEVPGRPIASGPARR